MSTALPILSKVSAVITDTGGITSHFATVTKEFGISCIVGTHTATKVLKNGQKIFVDADRGEVYSKIPKIDEFGIGQDVVWFTESGKRLNLIGTKALNLITTMRLGLLFHLGLL